MTPNFSLSIGSYSIMKFPSGELQVKLDLDSFTSDPEFATTEDLWIHGSILSSDHLMELCQLVAAIRYEFYDFKLFLEMPYCAYSRQDRICNPGESFSLKVFTDIINSLGFSQINCFDNHSDVSTALLTNGYSIPVTYLAANIPKIYDYLISPDAGANKKTQSCSKSWSIPMLRADKLRDTSTGSILETIIYATPAQLDNSTVLILDDICDGGRTFIELAKAIHSISPTCTIHLYITHGFFSKGPQPLLDSGISHIFTTDSVCTISHSNLTVLA